MPDILGTNGKRGVDPTLIIAMKRKHPCLTLQFIGNHFDLSRERVRQVLTSVGIDTGFRKKYFICNQCHTKFLFKAVAYSSQLFCSRACHDLFNAKPLALCFCGCGETFPLRASFMRRNFKDPRYKGHFFKNRSHFGRWCGLTHGFAAHPEHRHYNMKAVGLVK